jgi:PleD family two-component response regulator
VAQLEGTESGDALARRTNGALARAKRAGRNRVELAR